MAALYRSGRRPENTKERASIVPEILLHDSCNLELQSCRNVSRAAETKIMRLLVSLLASRLGRTALVPINVSN